MRPSDWEADVNAVATCPRQCALQKAMQSFYTEATTAILPVIVCAPQTTDTSISGLVVEYIVAIDVTRVRFPADAL